MNQSSPIRLDPPGVDQQCVNPSAQLCSYISAQASDRLVDPRRCYSSLQLHQLLHFLAVVDCGSFSRAAEQLSKSQQALSKSVQALEESLGVRLFNRSVRTVSLTAFGNLLLPYARNISDQAAGFGHALVQMQRSERGQVRVGASPSTTSQLVPEAILRLTSKRRDLQIAVLSGVYQTMVRDLLAGELDLFVCIDNGETAPPQVVQEPLMRAEYRVLASISHPLAKTRLVSAAMLREYGWVLGRNLGEIEHAWRHSFEQAGIVAPEPLVETTSIEFSKSVLQSSDYLTVMPVQHVEAELERQELCCIAAENFRWERPIVLCYRRSAALSAGTRVVIDALRRAAEKYERIAAIA